MLQSGALERNAVLIKNLQTVLWGSGGAGAQRTISAGVVRSCPELLPHHHSTPTPHHTHRGREGGGGAASVPSYLFFFLHTHRSSNTSVRISPLRFTKRAKPSNPIRVTTLISLPVYTPLNISITTTTCFNQIKPIPRSKFRGEGLQYLVSQRERAVPILV